jgi:hypothetical protein
MGVLGKYLDLLPAAARERIHCATRWTVYAYVDAAGARNLLGHAEDWSWPEPNALPICGAPEVFALRATAGDDLWTYDPRIGARFARLVKRRGLEAAVALVRAHLDGAPPLVTRVHKRGNLILVR